MNVTRWNRLRRLTVGVLSGAALLLGTSSCGGGGGGGSGSGVSGMVLVDFIQAGQDNVPLNRVLEFRFSAAVDPNSVDPASIQIRQGPDFGAAVFGKYIIQSDRVYFEPRLPGLCDLSDSGFGPNTDYRVSFIGAPEEFAIRSLTGDPLQATVSATFHTRLDTDPELFEDQIPGQLPYVVSTSPVNGTPNVPVGATQNNVVTITFSENLNPCSVSESTILLYQYATGGPGGFFPANDQTPGDPFTWGSGIAQAPPRRVRTTFNLQQDFLSTTLTLTPIFGEFPDNALLVAQVTNQVKDFGGNPIVPFNFSFTTENRPAQTKSITWEFNGDVSINGNATTAEVNTARAPSRAQGFLLIAGDGDNGANLLIPSGPDASKGPLGCTTASVQPNDGTPDDFDPLVDTLLSTGATRNTCTNSTDGTAAVVFEYRTFRIRTGVTVRLTGVNPAIILVRGDINIESGARLMARGDGGGGGSNSAGSNGINGSFTTEPAGGIGVAGAGNGGKASNIQTSAIYSGNGVAGFGSPDAFLPPGLGGAATTVRQGAGRGAVGTFLNTSVNPGANRESPGGGGGGHAAAGATGANNGQTGTMITLMDPFVDGVGGATYGNIDGKMFKAEAGSGGGGGGLASSAPYFSGNTTFQGTGGAGGAGGGFVDLTTTADIKIFGSIDAAGSRGGNGVTRYIGGNAFYGGAGGGGGGSGGGIRLLTPSNIVLGAGATLTVAGGTGGTGPAWAQGGAVANPGGNGGVGRLVLEDSDSVIQGYGGATVIPGDGAPAGFYRGVFDATRFQGGGIRPVVVSNLIDVGPFSPTYLTQDQQYVPSVPAPGTPRQDFVAGIPPIARNPNGTHTGIFLEVQGYPSNADGTANTLAPTGWKSVGYFKDSGSQTFPVWVANAQPPAGDIAYAGGILPGNTGNGINLVNGNEFVQFRITFYLPTTMGVFDPGPYIDSWTLNFQYDQ